MQHTLAILLLLTLAAACGATDAQIRERELCYTRAETESQKRVDKECAGMTFSACPAADDIVEDLRKAQEACP